MQFFIIFFLVLDKFCKKILLKNCYRSSPLTETRPFFFERLLIHGQTHEANYNAFVSCPFSGQRINPPKTNSCRLSVPIPIQLGQQYTTVPCIHPCSQQWRVSSSAFWFECASVSSSSLCIPLRIPVFHCTEEKDTGCRGCSQVDTKAQTLKSMVAILHEMSQLSYRNA